MVRGFFVFESVHLGRTFRFWVYRGRTSSVYLVRTKASRVGVSLKWVSFGLFFVFSTEWGWVEVCVCSLWPSGLSPAVAGVPQWPSGRRQATGASQSSAWQLHRSACRWPSGGL